MVTTRLGAVARSAGNSAYLVAAVTAVLEVVATSVGGRPGGHLHMHVDGAGWVLLCVGPLALLARRRYPVATLAIALLSTVGPHNSRFAYISVIVAFLNVIVSGHRRAAWAGAVSGYVLAMWINPLLWG